MGSHLHFWRLFFALILIGIYRDGGLLLYAADQNIIESILKQQYLFPKRRNFAQNILLSLCDNNVRHPYRITLPQSSTSSNVEAFILGGTLSADLTIQLMFFEFLIVFPPNSASNESENALDVLGSSFQTTLVIDSSNKLASSKQCFIIDKEISLNDHILSYAISCSFSITSSSTTILNQLIKLQDFSLPFKVHLESPNTTFNEWIPLCKTNAHTSLSKHLTTDYEAHFNKHRFYHSLIGCTKPLMNIDKLEAQWPGIMKQWIMHHIYLMGMGYISIYDIDGSAWEYVKEYVYLGIVRYYGKYTFQQFESNFLINNELRNSDNGNIKISIDNTYYNFLVNTHCVWDNKGKTEWLIVLSSPAFFINDYNVGGTQLGQYLDSYELHDAIAKLEIIQHDIRQLNIPTTTSQHNDISIFTTFPYIRLESIKSQTIKYKLIIDPHKIATLLDNNLFDSDSNTTSQYHRVQYFIREYSSITKNVTVQPNTIGYNNGLIIDNTMEKLIALQFMIQTVHDLVVNNSEISLHMHQRDLIHQARASQATSTPLDDSNIKLLIIAPGLLKIPPIGYGAVESIIWNYYQTLPNHNINVTVINSLDINYILSHVQVFKPDVIHIQTETFAYLSNRLSEYAKLVLVTTHSPYFANPIKWTENTTRYFDAVTIASKSKPNIHFFIVNKEHSDVLTTRWNVPLDRIHLVPNGVEVESYHFDIHPLYPNVSITVGKVEERKNQHIIQSSLLEEEIVFVGPSGNYSQFNYYTTSYLGSWTKKELYNNLTKYGNLVHLAKAETAAPLVVLEALAAGLGIVVTVNASANLDVTKPFITIIPDEKLSDEEFLRNAIRKNREISVTMRNEIREYAKNSFSWKEMIIPRYVSKIHELLQEQKKDYKVFPYSWGLKYHRIRQMANGIYLKPPYFAMMSILDSISSSITIWIEYLRLIGVDMILFYLLYDDLPIDILTDYIRKGIVEVHYISEFAYYHTLDPDHKANLISDKYFHILIDNDAIAYMQVIGATWMTILHEHDYFYERFPMSGMTRNGLKYYLKQQEQRQVDILIVYGKRSSKLMSNISVFDDFRFAEQATSRSIVLVNNTVFHGPKSMNCIIGDKCKIERLLNTDPSNPISLISLDVDYAWQLQANQIINSANDEINYIVNELSKHYTELYYTQYIATKRNVNDISNDDIETQDEFDKLIIFVTSYRKLDLSIGSTIDQQKMNSFLRLAKQIQYPLIVYTDHNTEVYLQTVSGGLPRHIIFHDIASLEGSHEEHVQLYDTIITNDTYRQKLSSAKHDKIQYNNANTMASLLSKMDYLDDVISRYGDYSYYAWIDFDYIQLESQIPQHINPSRLLPNKVMVSMISMPDWNTSYSREQLLGIDEVFLQGSTFIVPNILVPTFHQLWRDELHRYHEEYIIDDDQSILYQVMLNRLDLFACVRPFKWNALYNTYLNEELIMYV